MHRRRRSASPPSAVRALAATASLVAALALTGCGSDSGAGGAGSAGSSAGAPAGTPSAVGTGAPTSPAAPGSTSTDPTTAPEALRFTGTTLHGKPFDGATLAGKPTVLWFWAPWCPTCKAQAKETARVAAEFEGRAHVVGVAGLDKQAAMEKFATDNNMDGFPQLSDEAGDVWKKFRVTQQSTYVVLDKDGRTAFTGVLQRGEGLADKLDKLVD